MVDNKLPGILGNLDFGRHHMDAISPPHIDDTIRELGRAAAERNQRSQQVADASAYQMIAAQTSAQQVLDQIVVFEAGLGEDEEAVLCVVGGPAGMLIYPQSIGFLSPDKLVFSGQDQNGHRVTSIQHVTQLSVLLQAVPVPSGEKPRRIGFHEAGQGDG